MIVWQDKEDVAEDCWMGARTRRTMGTYDAKNEGSCGKCFASASNNVVDETDCAIFMEVRVANQNRTSGKLGSPKYNMETRND